MQALALGDPEIAERLKGVTLRKVVVVKDRIVNLVVS